MVIGYVLGKPLVSCRTRTPCEITRYENLTLGNTIVQIMIFRSVISPFPFQKSQIAMIYEIYSVFEQICDKFTKLEFKDGHI